MTAALAGFLAGITSIAGIHWVRTDNTPWAYPLLLALFPLFWMGFAIHGDDTTALWKEIAVGAAFFALCALCAVRDLRFSAWVMAAGFLLHGVYDVIHPYWFINAGAPDWWDAFCGTADIVIAAGVAVLAIHRPRQAMLYSTDRDMQ